MITVSNLNFEYDGTRVLHDMSFSIKKGDIVALVGPNGAGKSTLMRSIAGLDTPISGDIAVHDIDVMEEPRRVHETMGYLSDFFGLYEDLTVYQHLLYFARSYGLKKSKIEGRINDVIDLTELTKYRDALAGSLSRGYRQRLGVAIAILHEPSFLLLDEPASGMDPEARVQLSRLFEKLRAVGMTLVVSSHILAELEDYCTSMIVIRDGRIVEHVYLDSETTDKAEEEKTVVEVHFDNDAAELKIFLDEQKTIADYKIDGGTCIISLNGDRVVMKDLMKKMMAHKALDISSFTPIKRTLQNRYLELAKEAAK